ncbi:MAG: RteC domain-containing protein [Bacteroidia bacterium]
MKKGIGIVFDELLARYIKTVEQNIQSRIKKARDKERIKAEIRAEIKFIIDWERTAKDNAALSELFLTGYRRGEDTGKILAFIRKTFGEDVKDIKPYTEIQEDGKRISFYLSEEEKALKQLALNDRKLMKFFIRYIANLDIRKRLREIFSAQEKQETKLQNNPTVKWTGSKDNKNEFVQLIYGLHQAGFINNGKGEITKITEALAGVFDIALGKNWQSNLSASIHKANSDYQPLIFIKIQEAYKQYTESLRKEKRKNKD